MSLPPESPAQSEQNTLETPEITDEQPPEITGEQAPENSNEQAPEITSEQTPENSNEQAPEITGEQTPENPNEQAPEITGEQTPENPNEQAPEITGEQAPENSNEQTGSQDQNVSAKPDYSKRLKLVSRRHIKEIPKDQQFMHALHQVDYKPLQAPKEEEEEDKYALIPLVPIDSDEAKEFQGTQWKNAQFLVQAPDEEGKEQVMYFPSTWIQKPTGVSLRAKVSGANIARKLFIEAAIHHQSRHVFSAMLEFHVATDIQDYTWRPLTEYETKPRRSRRQAEDTAESSEQDQPIRDSFCIVDFNTTGGKGIALDFDAEYFDDEDEFTLDILRQMSKNFGDIPAGDTVPVIFRLNARHITYQGTDGEAKRKNAVNRRFFEQFESLTDNAQPVFAPYLDLHFQPATQWGQQIGRQVVQSDSGGALIPFRAQTSFATLAEYQVTMAYACHLEWKIEDELAHSLARTRHRVAFVTFEPATVLAFVDFNFGSLNLEEWQPREGSWIEIAFRPPNKIKLEDLRCAALMTPNIFQLSTTAHIFVVAAKPALFKDFATPIQSLSGGSIRYLDCTIGMRVPREGAQRQVDAVNRVCQEPCLRGWAHILLNQKGGGRNVYGPFVTAGISHNAVETAIEAVLSMENMMWSESQIACIRSIPGIPERILLIEGFPGSGKTFTLVAIASILRRLGIHVLFTAPTHYAADSICEKIATWNNLTGEELNPLRIYRPKSEARAFRTHGYSQKDRTMEAEEADVEMNSEEFVTSNQPSNANEWDQEAFQDTAPEASQNAAPEAPQNVGDNEADTRGYVRMSEILASFKQSCFTRDYSMPGISLEARVFELASTPGETLIATFPTDQQIEQQSEDLFDSIEDGTLEPEGEELDALEILRSFARDLQEYHYRQMEKPQRARALLAFKKASKAVVKKAELIVSTNNNVGDTLISTNFGDGASSIWVIRDEDPKETEPNTLVPFKLQACEKIHAIISCGDRAQLSPLVTSLQAKERLSEFSQQLGLSLHERLLRMNHPSQVLNEQFRFRPEFVDWLNHRTYRGLMQRHISTDSITIKQGFLEAMSEVLKLDEVSSSRTDLGNVAVSVTGSNCVVDPRSHSRYNDAHRLFVLQLVIANYQHDGYAGRDFVIISNYQAQAIRYRQDFYDLVKHGIIPADAEPIVATTDSMQGKESKLVVFDWVISQANGPKDLGFTSSDNRCNVGLTRMTDALVSIIPSCVGTGALSERPKVHYDHLGERTDSKIPYPCAYVSWMSNRRGVSNVDCPKRTDIFPFAPTEEDSADANTGVEGSSDDTGKGKEKVDEASPTEENPADTAAAVEGSPDDNGKGKEKVDEVFHPTATGARNADVEEAPIGDPVQWAKMAVRNSDDEEGNTGEWAANDVAW